uniref:Uncharacterized protein n=1 Tax=Aegilops tauschii subsp. strangulata TaxID=200361 RepID=A0A453S139_AEGTS
MPSRASLIGSACDDDFLLSNAGIAMLCFLRD